MNQHRIWIFSKINPFFSWEPALWLLNSQGRVMRRLSKKLIAIFGYKQRLLSLDMKTKLVQHVKSDWMRDWMSVRVRKSEIVRESESEREWECDLVPSFCLTFRHFFVIHEQKYGENIFCILKTLTPLNSKQWCLGEGGIPYWRAFQP